MKTFAGQIKKGKQKLNFELSAPSEKQVRSFLKKGHKDWDVEIKESHNSVYKGKFGKPKIKEHKTGGIQ